MGELEAQLRPVLKSTVLNPRRQELIRGTILLWHDHLEPAHNIAQSIEDADGSLLHAIMHRREPDFGNSKYWFRRVGKHSVFASIAEIVVSNPRLADSGLLSKLLSKDGLDPYAFVDACEAAERSGASASVLKQIQMIEFEAFLEYLAG